jgi:hypothetical protein
MNCSSTVAIHLPFEELNSRRILNVDVGVGVCDGVIVGMFVYVGGIVGVRVLARTGWVG